MAVRRSAMKARIAAHRQITSLLITAPDAVRTRFATLDGDALIDTLAATRPGNPPSTPSVQPPGMRYADWHGATRTSPRRSPTSTPSYAA